MTDVDTLTAHLNIGGLVEFSRGLAQADAAVDVLRKSLRGLTEDALAARGALAGLGVNLAPAVAEVTAVKEQIKGVRDTAVEADAAMEKMKPPASALPDLAAIKREVQGIRDAALEADIAMRGMGGGGAGGRTSRSVLDAAEQSNAAEIRRIYNTGVRHQFLQEEARLRSGEALAPNLSDALGGRSMADFAAARNASELLRLRMQAGALGGRRVFGGDDVLGRAGGFPIRGAGLFGLSGSSLDKDIESQARRDASQGGLLGLLFGSTEARRIAESGGGDGGGSGVNRGALAGLLPGGARGSQAAVTTLLGVGAAALPAIAPSVLAAAPILGAGLGSLVGAAGTLKLAFADLSSAAFTNRAAFLALTPVQQQFVQTLRSADAGLLAGNLEPLAQKTLLPQLTAALHTALTPAAVSSLQGGVGAFANALGGGAQQFGTLFGSPVFQAQFGTMLKQDADYLRTFLSVFTNLFEAFVHFQVAAGPFLTWVGKGVEAWSAWADAAIKADQANGRLSEFFGIIQTSLQTTGNLLSSVGHLASAFVDAIGFQNSVSLVNLLAKAINDVANLLKQNSKALSDFFGGAVGAAGDLLGLVNGMLQALKPVLSTIDSLVGGVKGFQSAIDALAVAFVARFLLMRLAVVGLIPLLGSLVAAIPELAIISAIVLIASHWRQVTESLPMYWRAAWDGIKGILDLGVYAILKQLALILDGVKRAFGWVPVIGGELSSVTDAFNSWVDSFNKNGVQDLSNSGALFANAFTTTFSSGMQNAMQGAVNLAGLTQKQILQFATQGAVAAAGSPGLTQADVNDAPVGLTAAQAAQWYKNHPAAIRLNLPQALNTAVLKAQSGNDTAAQAARANAAAYAFYQNQLQASGLTSAQRAALYGAEAQYAPATSAFGKNPAFGSSGTGWQIPVQYQVAITNAQQAGSVAGQIAATKNAIAYINGIYNGLSPANRIAAESQKQSLVSSLQGLQGTGSAMSGVGFLSQAAQASLANAQQTAAGITATTPVTSQNLQSVRTLIASLKTDHTTIADSLAKGAYAGVQRKNAVAEELALTNQLVAAQKILTGLQLQVPPGQAARLQQALQRTAGLTASSPATDQSIIALNGLLVQQVATMKDLVAEMKKAGSSSQKQAADKQLTTLKDQHAATVKLRDSLEATRKEAKTLGISSAPGAVSAARETSTVRTSVNALLKQFGLTQTGSASLGPFVQELYKMGDINKRQYESLEKILSVITDAKNSTGKIATSITGNISARLAEIKQELQAQTGFTLTGAQHSLSGILRTSGAHLSGTAAQRARFLEQGQYALAHHGTVLSTAGAAMGVPLTRHGAPSLTGVHMTVEVKGNTRIDRENARLIANELRRQTGRNSVQMTGSNAGVNMGT